jgi:hypothetical protein
MTVTDEQVAALRAQLADEVEEHRRLLDQLDPVASRTGYPALVAAAFAQAVDRWFTGPDDVGIIQLVSEIRSRGQSVADRLDPDIAERFLRAAISDEDVDGVSTEASFRTQLILLGGLISDEHLDGGGLDRTLAEARKLADEWLA